VQNIENIIYEYRVVDFKGNWFESEKFSSKVIKGRLRCQVRKLILEVDSLKISADLLIQEVNL